MKFDHTFIDNQAAKTLVLLHGTGGGLSDFLFLNDHVQDSYNLLALKGNISEDGMARFFRRLSPGVFDQENIKAEAKKLQEFISEWCKIHKTEVTDLVFLGYSNGANMILATLFYFPEKIRTAVLLHPMVPFVPENISLAEQELFLTFGDRDPMVSDQEKKKLLEILEKVGASPIVQNYPGGHQISSQELQDVLNFLMK